MVQWLGLHASAAEGGGSIRDWGTKIPQVAAYHTPPPPPKKEKNGTIEANLPLLLWHPLSVSLQAHSVGWASFRGPTIGKISDLPITLAKYIRDELLTRKALGWWGILIKVEALSTLLVRDGNPPPHLYSGYRVSGRKRVTANVNSDRIQQM